MPTVVDVDQDSSGDENVESRPGQKGEVVQLLKYYGKPTRYKQEVCLSLHDDSISSSFLSNYHDKFHSRFHFYRLGLLSAPTRVSGAATITPVVLSPMTTYTAIEMGIKTVNLAQAVRKQLNQA